MKNRFVMLLIDSWDCRIDDKCGEGEEVKRSCFNVERDKRESVIDDFGRETISAHDIEIFDVADVVAYDVIDVKDEDDNVIVVIVTEDADEGEIGKVDEVATEDFFACFVRICSCSLILLEYLAEQRLQAKISAFSFAIRVFSVCWCCSWRAFSASRCCLTHDRFRVLLVFKMFFARCKWMCIDCHDF